MSLCGLGRELMFEPQSNNIGVIPGPIWDDTEPAAMWSGKTAANPPLLAMPSICTRALRGRYSRSRHGLGIHNYLFLNFG